MIVNHRAGETVSALMNRQFRSVFNIGVPAGTAVTGVLLSLPLWNGLALVVPAAGVLTTYAVNLKGRRHRIRPYALKKTTPLTEEWMLELQDIFFRMPEEHKEPVQALLDGAYEQIERGNPDAVNIRLEKARALKKAVVSMNALLDTQEDLKKVDQHVRQMRTAIEA